MAAETFYLPFRPAFDVNGLVIPGAQLLFYQSGNLTPQAIYQDAALTIEHTNPVVANAAGRFAPIYMDGDLTYRVILKNEEGTTIDQEDPYIPGFVNEGPAGPLGQLEDNSGIIITKDPARKSALDIGQPEENEYSGWFLRCLSNITAGGPGPGMRFGINAGGHVFMNTALTLSGLFTDTGAPYPDPTHERQIIPTSDSPMVLSIFPDVDLGIQIGTIPLSGTLSDADLITNGYRTYAEPYPGFYRAGYPEYQAVSFQGPDRLEHTAIEGVTGDISYCDPHRTGATINDRVPYIKFGIGRKGRKTWGPKGAALSLQAYTEAEFATDAGPDAVSDGPGAMVAVSNGSNPGIYVSDGARYYYVPVDTGTVLGPDSYGWTPTYSYETLASANITASGTKAFLKDAGGDGAWNASVYSTTGITGDQLVEFVVGDLSVSNTLYAAGLIASSAVPPAFDYDQKPSFAFSAVVQGGTTPFVFWSTGATDDTNYHVVVEGDRIGVRKIDTDVWLEINGVAVANGTMTTTAPAVSYRVGAVFNVEDVGLSYLRRRAL